MLKLHIRKHTGEKPFKCLLCVDSGTAFSQLPHLKKHMASIHKQTNPYICEGCYESFKMKVEYQAHTSDCEKYKKKHAEEGEDGVREEEMRRAENGINFMKQLSRIIRRSTCRCHSAECGCWWPC